MPSQRNKQAVQKIQEKLQKAKSVIFASYHGLNASDMNELREKIKEAGGNAQISKNSLVKVALQNEEMDDPKLESSFQQSTITIYGIEDALTVIKALYDFSKEKNNLPQVKAGIVNEIPYGADKIEELSNIPSKEELYAKLVGSINSPISGFVGTLANTRNRLVYVLNSIADQKA